MSSAKTINIRAVVHAGSANEQEARTFGAAHFLEHMFFKGTEKRNYSEINRKFAQLGDVNAYTSLERTVFYMNSLLTLLDDAAELFFELFFSATMPAEEFEKERGVIIEEFQSSEDNPISWGIKKINWDTWGDSMHPTIGTRESIEALSIEDIVHFKQQFYRPENTLFVITGALDEKELWDTVSAYIPDMQIPSQDSLVAPTIQFKTDHFQLDNPNSKQSLLFMVFPTVSELESRKLRFLPDLVVNLIGGGMHSVLFESVRERLGLCYAVGMQYMTPLRSGYHSVYALLDANNVGVAHDEVLNQLRMLEKEIPNELFETAKSNLLFGRSRANETASGTGAQADSYFDNGHDLIPFDEYREGIESLKIEDIQDFVKNYLNDPKLAVVNAKLPV